MSYKEGIVKAIESESPAPRNGTSMIAIKKTMQAKLPSDKKWLNATFLASLKTGVVAGDFVQLKGSYKLSPEFKKKRAAALKPKPKKKVAPKKKSSTKKAGEKKSSSKMASKKTVPKKKVVAKKAKKTVAKKKPTKKASKKVSKQ